jgi:hypothetical protein
MENTTRTLIKRAALTLAVGGTLAFSANAHAALDEVMPKASPEITTTQMAGQVVRVRTRGSLREFAGADGKVFGAHWEGLTDLQSLLGSHYASYMTAVRGRTHRGHHVVQVSTPEFTASVVAYGQLFKGTFVLTQSLPKGVTIDALR